MPHRFPIALMLCLTLAPAALLAQAPDDDPRAKLDRETIARQDRAAAQLESAGTLIGNGDFEDDRNGDKYPDHWGRLDGRTSWETEKGNRFLRIRSSKPGDHAMLYRVVDLPADVGALELTWRLRLSGFKRGAQPWHDARLLMEFLDASGEKMAGGPGASSAAGNTKGWIEKSKRFLVPAGAAQLVLMPGLFQAEAGTLDLDGFTLRPTDPKPLIAERNKKLAMRAASVVPAEEADESKWPAALRVEGNRVLNAAGEAVTLRGVNAGGLETLPYDDQPVKSTVVAIDDWGANCVRLPLKHAYWFGESTYQDDGGAAYRERVDRIVKLAANRGAYVILDLHDYRAPRAEHARFWTDAAKRYADHPAVLFDLLNEPHGISWEQWRDGGFIGVRAGVDEAAFLSDAEKRRHQGFDSIGMQGLLDAVRATGAKNVVVASGVSWANDLSGIAEGHALTDADGRGVIYSWHVYNWHRGWEKRVLATAERHPVIVGEFGADTQKLGFIPKQNQEDPHTWVPDLLGFIQTHGLHWTAWCFHPSATPRLITDWDYEPTPFFGKYIKDALAGKRYELTRPR